MERLKIIHTLADLEKLKEYLKDKQYAAVDTETDGVSYESKVIGYSICCNIEEAFYVITRRWNSEKSCLEVQETESQTQDVMKLLTAKRLIMHNAIFDCAMINRNYGVDLMPYVHTDTMILGHVLDENRSNALKSLGETVFGENARREQIVMQASVKRNGGKLTKKEYELYKGDPELIAEYGAKDALLTFKLFITMVPELFEQNLDKFFYDEESMPLLRGVTYDLNTVGLKIDPYKLSSLKKLLEIECVKDRAFIDREIHNYVKDKYPGTSKAKTFNINATQQLSWLLFDVLENEFRVLTKGGKDLCKFFDMKIPYTAKAKEDFIRFCKDNIGVSCGNGKFNSKTEKTSKPPTIGNYWKYAACGVETLVVLSKKYKWVETLLCYKKKLKLLNTYVVGIEERMKYNVIYPSFLQHGTTSGRYSSRNPNFQNLPREDKRIKSCIVPRPGRVFVGADYAQLEPRVFASISGDTTLMNSFTKGEDFYSVVGAPIFDKTECSLYKDDDNSFAKLHPDLRHRAKVVALATPYGISAHKQANSMGISLEESRDIINKYFAAYPKVQLMMLTRHEEAKNNGVVRSMFGRPRRIPEATSIPQGIDHADLPYELRTLLNLAVNHTIQSTAASIVNRASIAFKRRCVELALLDERWKNVNVVLQVHDEIVVEGPEELGDNISVELKNCMEKTVVLPGVALIAEPKIGRNLAELK